MLVGGWQAQRWLVPVFLNFVLLLLVFDAFITIVSMVTVTVVCLLIEGLCWLVGGKVKGGWYGQAPRAVVEKVGFS